VEDIRAPPVKEIANLKRKWALLRAVERNFIFDNNELQAFIISEQSLGGSVEKSPPHFQAGIFQGYRFCPLAVCQHGTLINLD